MDSLLGIWTEYIKPNLAVLGLLATWVAIAAAVWRRRVDFRAKRFDAVNFSLNYVLDGRLAMRTLLESTLKEVWLNDHGIGLVVKASRRTTKDQPFIVMKDAADMDYVKRALMNVLSERFAEAYLAESQGLPARQATFVFALTYERYETINELKFRVMIAEEKALQESFGPGAPPSAVEQTRHLDRLGVLRRMAELAAKPGALVEGADVLGRLRLGVVCQG